MKLERDPTRATPTGVLIKECAHSTNPVTRSVLTDIIGRRVDRVMVMETVVKDLKSQAQQLALAVESLQTKLEETGHVH